MTDKVSEIAEALTDLPVNQRPFVRSLIVSRMAAQYEESGDPLVNQAWIINTQLQNEDLASHDKADVFRRAIFLVTLPKSEDKQKDSYFGWLRGNGLVILQDKSMQDYLISELDNPQSDGKLASSLDSILSTDVEGLKMDDLSERPDVYSLFIAFLVCRNFQRSFKGVREDLLFKAIDRMADPEVSSVIAYFGEIEDTKELYESYKAFKAWATY